MNPSLYMFKRGAGKSVGRSSHSLKTEIHFVVVNLDEPKAYPMNFICVLPQDHSVLNGTCNFNKIFGDGSLQMAKTLLVRALESEGDSEIKAEIGKRLRHFEPKPVIQVKCRICGNLFEPKTFRGHQQKTCRDCKKRMLAQYG
jgi:hypothetical protein